MKALTPLIMAGFMLLGSLPSTSNYQLNSYAFGSGGTANSSTANYALEGVSGEASSATSTTSNYQIKSGFVQTQQADVPKVTLSNPASYYDKLLFVLDTQNNPTDALYALQISTASDFSSGISYIKSDHTIGASLTVTDYQTYAAWGSGSGTTIIGLAANTTYYIRAKATQGKFSESGYGPSSSAATVGQQLSFCAYSNANCAAGGSSEAFGVLTPSTVINSPTNIGVDFVTNADSGGYVYIYSANGGLTSNFASYTISSATGDLSSLSEGYGAVITSVSQVSGGPLSKVSPYNGASNNVGQLSTNVTTLLSAGAPLTGGSATITLKAKAAVTTRAASDYADTITLIAAAAF